MEKFESEIMSNNKKISALLKENEKLLTEAGYLPPGSDWEPRKDGSKIHFPEGYIRPHDYFIKKYKLNVIVRDKAVRKNIAYSFQLADYYGYFIRRFHICGSVSIMFYKHDIINLVSIIEALSTCATNSIADNGKKVFKSDPPPKPYPGGHDWALKYLKSALEWASTNKITHLTKQQINDLNDLYELRNHVHIEKDKPYDYGSKEFNKATHDLALSLVEQVADDINAHWVKYYYLPLPGCTPQHP